MAERLQSRCVATVTVRWRGALVTVTVSSPDVERTLREVEHALLQLGARGAELKVCHE